MRPFHPGYIVTAFLDLFPYIWVTLAVMAGTVFFGGLLGLILARAKIKRGRISKALAEIYIYVTRCIPSIVMLFIVYYGLPELLLVFGVDINHIGKAFFVIVTFSILFASSMCEVFRSSYLAIDPGQREAALSIGLTEWQAFRRILLPQCTIVALPNFANMLVNLMKEGALAYTIGIIDIMGEGQLIIGRNQGSYVLEVYLGLTVIYWLMTLIIEKVFKEIEKKLSAGKKLVTAA
jgi:L-cystine transport system permease protein